MPSDKINEMNMHVQFINDAWDWVQENQSNQNAFHLYWLVSHSSPETKAHLGRLSPDELRDIRDTMQKCMATIMDELVER